jgi:hypothetical protein
MILPKGDTLYPMGSTRPFEMQCWVQQGAKPVWTLGTDPLQTHDLVPTAAEKYENSSLIFINTTGNYSCISITDEGFEMYTSVNGSAKLHIGCIPHQSCFACPSNETAILKIIVLFGKCIPSLLSDECQLNCHFLQQLQGCLKILKCLFIPVF